MYVCVVQCACVTYNVHALRTMYTSQVQCACITYIVRATRRSMYVVQVHSKIFFFSVARVNRREQWDDYIRNDDIRESLGVTSVEEAARVSRLRWFGHVQRIRDDRLPKSILSAEVLGVEVEVGLEGGLTIRLGRICKLLDWKSRLLLMRKLMMMMKMSVYLCFSI